MRTISFMNKGEPNFAGGRVVLVSKWIVWIADAELFII